MSLQIEFAPGKLKPHKNIFRGMKWRDVVYQLLTLIVLGVGLCWVINNTVENLQRAHIVSGFDFLNGRAGFDISQTLLPFSADSSYGDALLTGLVNTLLVAASGIVAATLLGLMVGLGRLSKNKIVSLLSTVFVEVFRNIPPLLIVFFWYVGVIATLPQVRESFRLPLSVIINNRGIFFPKLLLGDAAVAVWLSVGIALLAGILTAWFSRRRQAKTGRPLPTFRVFLALLLALPAAVLFFWRSGIAVELPQPGRFRIEGGFSIGPEFLSLFLALSFYTAAYIAEIVRAGVKGVARGQSEAANALGLSSSLTTRLVVVPQALRIIIPPLTSQYLNLVKDTSLAIAVGYADLVSIGGTIMNQTGQAIEVMAIWALVFLSLSLLTSAFMNWFNLRVALVER